MNPPKQCAKCGTVLPPDAPAGVCPKCLLQAGLSDSAEDVGANSADGETVLTDAAGLGRGAELPPTERDGRSSSGFPDIGTRIQYIGDYELLREIARGGMGVVYKARQVRLNRVVALKMILAGQFASPADVQRFQTEAEAAAQLDHVGIVPVFEVGQHDGHHYFSMGLVEGESLAKRIADGPLPPRTAAEIVLQVAEAIQYAHGKGVIHRDLKPANVLLDKTGQPRVTDFGLAKRIQGDSHLTASGQILGTPSYMPPEQAAGRIDQVSETADVYSLGAILYATLTGRPPFQADNPLDTVMQVIEREPVSPHTLNPAIPLDLETVCLKCLEKDRRKRYGSASDLAEELRRYLNGKPILARPVGRVERAWRWCRRNPIVAGLLAAVALSLAGGTWVSTWFAIKAQARAEGEAEQRREAVRQTSIAQEQLTRSEWLLYANTIAAAHREGELNNPTGAIGHLDRTQRERRGWEFYYLRSQNTQSQRLSIAAHDQKVLALARSVDGRLIASSGRDRKVALWDATSGRALSPIDCEEYVTHLSFSSDATLLVGVATSGRLFLWKTDSGGLHREIVTSPLSALAAAGAVFLPDGKAIVTNNKDGTLHIWDITTGEERRLISPSVAVLVIAVSPDGRYLASGGLASDKQSEIRLISLLDANAKAATSLLDGRVTSLAFAPDAQRLVVSSIDPSSTTEGTVRVLVIAAGPASGSEPVLIPVRARHVAFTADGRQLIAIQPDGSFVLLDAKSGNPIRQLQSPAGPEDPMVASGDAGEVAVGSNAGTIAIWRTAASQPPVRLPLTEWGYSVAFSPDGSRVASGSSKVVTVWDVVSGEKLVEIPAHNGTVNSVVFHPRGDKVLSGSWDGTTRMWNVPDGRELFRAPAGPRAYDSLAVSPLGDQFAKGQPFTAEIQLLNAESGEPQATFGGLTERVSTVAIAADGQRLVSGGEQGEIALWDLRRRSQLWTVREAGENREIRSIAFSPDGTLIATAGKTLSVWDASTGKLRFTLQDPSLAFCVRFTPDGRRVVAGCLDSTIRFWAAESGEPVYTLPGHEGRVYSLAFSPDGRRLATTGDAGAVFIRDCGQGLK